MKITLLLLFAVSLYGATPAAAPPSSSPGTIWRDGSAIPVSTLGVNGDYYLQRVTGAVYKKTNGVYAIVANLRGPAGTPGTPGTPGTQGEPGEAGSNVPDPRGHDHEFLVVLNGALTYSKSAPPAPTVSFTSTTAVGGTATFTVNTVGLAPFTYQWSKDGNPIAGKTGSSLAFPSVTAADSGTYTCTVTNAVGATTTSASTLLVQ